MENMYDSLIVKRTVAYRKLEKQYKRLQEKQNKSHFRKRKNYFNQCSKQKKRFLKSLNQILKQSSKFCNSAGLKLDKAFLKSKEIHDENEDIIDIFISNREETDNKVKKGLKFIL